MVQVIGDFFPEGGPFEALLHGFPELASPDAFPRTLGPKATFSKMDLGKGLGRWKTMPTLWRRFTGFTSGAVDVLPVQEDRARRPGSGE